MLSAFGVDDGRLVKAKKLTDEQKRTATGVGVTGAGVYGYHAGTSLRARNTAQHLSDPERAKHAAETMAAHRGHAATESVSTPYEGIRRQEAAYDKATKANPDVKRVRDSADRWSSTFRSVKRIRRAYDKEAPVPGVGRVLLRPVKSKAESDSNVMRHLNNAKTEGPTLHRGMRTAKQSYKVGDEVDFHDLTSWSADKKVAGHFAARGRAKHGTPHVFQRDPGHATSYESASPQFQQREWVAGGKHKVTGINPDGSIRVSHIKAATNFARFAKYATSTEEITMAMSAFGVEDSRLSKADDRRTSTGLAATSGAVGGAGGVVLSARRELGQHKDLMATAAEHGDNAKFYGGRQASHNRRVARAAAGRAPGWSSVAAEHAGNAHVFGGLAAENKADQARALRRAKNIRGVVGVRAGVGLAAGAAGAGLGAAIHNRGKRS